MHPYLFTTESLSLPTYGTLYLLAFLASIFTIAHLSTRLGIPFWRMVDLGFMFAIAGEVGARITFLITEWPRFQDGTISLKQFFLAGRVVLGGVVVGTLFAMWLFHRYRLPVLPVCDAAITGVTLGMGIGRMGCLMAGCCYGKPTDLWWGITFTDPLAHAFSGTPLDVPLHPTQILQALDAFVLFAFLYWMFGRRRFDGQVLALYFLLQGMSRFLVEFLRDDPRGGAAGFATSQWIGLAMLATGVLIFWMRWGRGVTQATPLRLRKSRS